MPYRHPDEDDLIGYSILSTIFWAGAFFLLMLLILYPSAATFISTIVTFIGAIALTVRARKIRRDIRG